MNPIEITLPLPAEVTRCLGHSVTFASSCDREATCARQLTLRHPQEPHCLPAERYSYMMCSNEDFCCWLPLEVDVDSPEVAEATEVAE